MNALMNKLNTIRRLEKTKMPFLVKFIFLFTPLVLFGDFTVLWFRIIGWGWFIPLLISILTLAIRLGRITFPVSIWIPWIIVIIIYQIFAPISALQRTVQLVCPIIIGIAVSTFRYSEAYIKKFISYCKYLAIALIVVVILRTGILLTGALPEITGLAAQVMTGMLLCTLFAARYATGIKKEILWWATLATIPVIALTRTAIVATGLTLPLTFAPLKLRKRAVILIAICLLGLVVFYTPRIQKKMFHSGEGEMSDVINKDFKDTGRFRMWDLMEDEIRRKPWFGHGANANEDFILAVVRFKGQPHNDWLRFLFDYGYFGTGIFSLCMIAQVLHLLKRARKKHDGSKFLFYAGASSFVSLSLLMITDNIIIYASYYTNLQFVILGMAYASSGATEEISEQKRSRIKITW
jgi:O-antigen ligase